MGLQIKKQMVRVGEYPVLIGIPIPMIDKDIKAELSNFVAGQAYRKLALPYHVNSRAAELGRNAIITDFLKDPQFRDFKYLLFMDADSVPIDLDAIERLIRHDKDVVAGVTPLVYYAETGEIGMYWNVKPFDCNHNLYPNELPSKLFKTEKVGGTGILIKRHVLEKLEPPYQRPTFDKEYINYELGEDYYFCDKIREAGFDIWIDPHIICHHYHTMDMLEILQMLNRYAEQTEEHYGKIMAAVKKLISIPDDMDRLAALDELKEACK